MNYFIIAIIVAIVLGPIMWMMPSTRQRQQVALRQYALAQGLQIKVCDLPQSHRQRVRKAPAKQGVIYRLPLANKRPITMTQVYCLSRAEFVSDQFSPQPEPAVTSPQADVYEWQGDSLAAVEAEFTAALQHCPASAVAIEYSAAGVACYWQERGGNAAVDQIKSALAALREQLKQGELIS
ncbi:hypothetical protein [Dasania marina]|uniref:hypothetical protein n=1 Tax=Dasania marina TaxID=471499 RepID=UPI00035EC49A|nr:hypothetical protein [Dasania marina]